MFFNLCYRDRFDLYYIIGPGFVLDLDFINCLLLQLYDFVMCLRLLRVNKSEYCFNGFVQCMSRSSVFLFNLQVNFISSIFLQF